MIPDSGKRAAEIWIPLPNRTRVHPHSNPRSGRHEQRFPPEKPVGGELARGLELAGPAQGGHRPRERIRTAAVAALRWDELGLRSQDSIDRDADPAALRK